MVGGRLVRRHSAKADLAADPLGVEPIASPPPGFGDKELTDESADDLADNNINDLSPKKSNSESSHAMVTDEGSDLISSTDMDDLQSSTNNSKVSSNVLCLNVTAIAMNDCLIFIISASQMTTSSPTVVSDLNPDVPLTPPTGPDAPLVKSDSFDVSDLDLGQMESPILRLKKQMMEALMSPDSESSSFHITSSASSSENKELDVQSTETSEEVADKPAFKHQSKSECEVMVKSPDISTSLLLSSSRVLQRKSDPTIEDKDALKSDESVSSRILYSHNNLD